MTTVRDQLAAALRGHAEVYDRFTERRVCTCDNWTEESFDGAFGHQTHAAHLADVLLALPDIAIVELVDPDTIEGWSLRYLGLPPRDSDDFATEARILAAALLAAAEVER